MKKFVQGFLKSLAKKTIKKYRPLIIGITGSVGKTSAKQAVFCVVRQKFSARSSQKNFNNEFGVPLTVLGADFPGKNPFAWLVLSAAALGRLIFRVRYPEVLILEMGVDHPGDMDYLLEIAKPDIGVITAIGESHLEFFKTLEAVETEKGKIAKTLSSGDWLILNADNDKAASQSRNTRARVLSYSATGKEAGVKISDIKESLADSYQTHFMAQSLSGSQKYALQCIGDIHLSAAACAIAVGECMKIEPDLVAKGLKEYRPAPGRQNLIPGIRKSALIDDTYNASLSSTKAALKLLEKLPAASKMAALGDMLELGTMYEAAHREIGELAAKLNLSRLVTVGPGGKLIAEAAKTSGMEPEKVLCFNLAADTLPVMDELIAPGSLVLIKGSQGMRMEKITKEIMAEPMRAQELLCRQYGKWNA